MTNLVLNKDHSVPERTEKLLQLNSMKRVSAKYLFTATSEMNHCSNASNFLLLLFISRHHQNEEPVFSKDYKVFFTTVPLKQGDQGTFNHITMISNRVKLRQTFMQRFSFKLNLVCHRLFFFFFYKICAFLPFPQPLENQGYILHKCKFMLLFRHDVLFIFLPPSPRAEAAAAAASVT